MPVEFETFWKAYPPRWNPRLKRWFKHNKSKACRCYNRLSDSDKTAAYKIAKDMERSEFVPDCWKWIIDRRWEDEVVENLPAIEDTDDRPALPTELTEQQIRENLGL